MTDLPHPPDPDPLADQRIQRIHRILSRRRPEAPTPAGAGAAAHAAPDRSMHASVALVVRPGSSDLDMLLIRRASFEGDPWSGHVALPGGRRSPADRSDFDTAVREAMEEVGIDLAARGTALGLLDEVRPRRAGPVVSVTPFVFAVPSDTGVTLNHEVASALWVPARHLADPASAIEHLHTLATGEHVGFPAIGYREFVIWGLTHQILSQFFEITRAEG